MSLPFILASSLTDKTKDDTRRVNELLFTELENLQREYKRERQVVEQLTKDYEESKDYDPVRRYEKLKVMVKRTIMHFKVNSEEQIIKGLLPRLLTKVPRLKRWRDVRKNTPVSYKPIFISIYLSIVPFFLLVMYNLEWVQWKYLTQTRQFWLTLVWNNLALRRKKW